MSQLNLTLQPPNKQQISALFDWTQEQPLLPWQKNASLPELSIYEIWLLEIMLQQTTLATIAKRFRLWLEQFPTLEALASAPIEQVLTAWEGLGYYNRAKNMHLTAQTLYFKQQGVWPNNLKALLALPGIGLYTAKAILARAYNQPILAFDANLKRLFQRLYGLKAPFSPADEAAIETHWQLILHAYGGYLINHSLMRLAQLLCKAKNPLCLACPWQNFCEAGQNPPTLAGASKPKSKAIITLSSLVLVPIELSTQTLWIEQREKHEIGADLYALPRFQKVTILELQEQNRALAPFLAKAIPLSAQTHHYTCYREKLWPYLIFISARDSKLWQRNSKAKEFFLAKDQLGYYAFLSVYRKIINESLALW